MGRDFEFSLALSKGKVIFMRQQNEDLKMTGGKFSSNTVDAEKEVQTNVTSKTRSYQLFPPFLPVPDLKQGMFVEGSEPRNYR